MYSVTAASGMSLTAIKSAREKIPIWFVIVLATVQTGCNNEAPRSGWINVLDLVQSPGRYEGYDVLVEGVLEFSDQEVFLYFSEEARTYKRESMRVSVFRSSDPSILDVFRLCNAGEGTVIGQVELSPVGKPILVPTEINMHWVEGEGLERMTCWDIVVHSSTHPAE